MTAVVFHANDGKPAVTRMLERLADRARAYGLRVAKPDGAADAVIALGGDGTILRAVHRFPDMPVLGLNFGGLGYLASVERRDFARALELLAAGRYTISRRRMLSVNGGHDALNDIVIMRNQSGHAASIDVKADGRLVTRYMADGVIFATPTGSTAYSLAAGGPVLMPDTAGLVVTPMNPHALGVRPLVVKDSVRFTVTACARTAGNQIKVGVYADGENVQDLDGGSSVEIARSAKTARLIELEGYDPYGVLARKLGWSGSNVRR